MPQPVRPLRLAALWHAIAWVLVAAVVVLSLLPTPPIAQVHGSDKLGHMLAYLMLMHWYAQVYARRMRWPLAALFILLGMLLEALQGLTPARHFDPADMLANTTGVLLGWLLIALPRMEWLVPLDTTLARLIDRRRLH
jgi:VanZ family protein